MTTETLARWIPELDEARVGRGAARRWVLYFAAPQARVGLTCYIPDPMLPALGDLHELYFIRLVELAERTWESWDVWDSRGCDPESEELERFKADVVAYLRGLDRFANRADPGGRLRTGRGPTGAPPTWRVRLPVRAMGPQGQCGR